MSHGGTAGVSSGGGAYRGCAGGGGDVRRRRRRSGGDVGDQGGGLQLLLVMRGGANGLWVGVSWVGVFRIGFRVGLKFLFLLLAVGGSVVA